MMTTARIMSAPDDEPERVFGSPHEIDVDFKEFAKRHHPDRPGGDAAVFSKINVLRLAARARLDAGLPWRTFGLTDAGGRLLIVTKRGEKWRLDYVRKYSVGIGDHYVGKNSATFLIAKKHEKLFDRGLACALRVVPKDREPEAVVPRTSIPKFEVDNTLGATFRKSPSAVLLRDLLAQQGGKISPTHVAWIVSRAYWFACLLHVNELVPTSLSIDDLYVDPIGHGAQLLGGWWFTYRRGDALTQIPSASIPLISTVRLREKTAVPGIATDLVRALGRTLLGDPGGSRMLFDDTIPQAMRQWLVYPGTENPVKEFEVWQKKILFESFGARRYVEMPVTFTDVYK